MVLNYEMMLVGVCLHNGSCSQVINQSINQSIKQSSNQAINQSIIFLASQSVSESVRMLVGSQPFNELLSPYIISHVVGQEDM